MAKLVQTRLPDIVGKWIEKLAKREGLSVAAWLRNHLIKLHSNTRMFTKAAEKVADERDKYGGYVEPQLFKEPFTLCIDCKTKSATIVCLRCRAWLCTTCQTSISHRNCKIFETVFPIKESE